MTTVAWDGKVLAADRRLSFGSIQGAEVTKIVKNKKGELCGAAGTMTLADGFRRWFLAGKKGKPPALEMHGETATAFIVKTDKTIVFYDPCGWFEFTSDKFAIGSGQDVALGAMDRGADAVEAVQAACRLDGGSSGSRVDMLVL